MIIFLILTVLATPLALTYFVKRKTRGSPVRVIDIGVAFCWIIFLYSFFPLVGIWLASIGIGTLTDNRFGSSVPEPNLVLRVGTSYAAFMLAFSCVYYFKRLEYSRPSPLVQVPTANDILTVVFIGVAIKLAILLLRLILGIAASDDYISSYTEFWDQPLLIQQLSGVLTATDFSSTVLIIVAAVAYTPKIRVLAAALIVVQIVFAMIGGGSRGPAFLSAFAYMVARSIFSRKLHTVSVALYAAIGVFAFILAGLIRGGIETGEGLLGLQLFQSGEFLIVFDNSLDLLDRLGDADIFAVKVGMYFVDVLRLIPQQIIGDIKIDPATVYVSTFYPEISSAGGGLAFGAIAESTVGFGWSEALVRGALLGWFYAAIANHCLNGKLTFVRAFVYVWFVVMSYQAIRDTTFSTIPRYLMQVLPLLIVLRLTGSFRKANRFRNVLNTQGQLKHT